MRHTIRENIHSSYSLHDMNVIAFEVTGDNIILRTQSGLVKTTPTCGQFNGHVEFNDVKWDFSYAYLLDFAGNEGTFSGNKMFLRDFISNNPMLGFTVIDETYGYNSTKYSGYITISGRHNECIIEIYHEGDMVFVDEREFGGMTEVILSHDSEAKIYLVPEEVAANLYEFCGDFAANWVWHGSENAKFLHNMKNGQIGAIFGAEDFIDYLNRWVFPGKQSRLVKGLGCYAYEIPEEYKDYPKYNF